MRERMEFHVRGQPLDGTPLHYTASGLDNVYLVNGYTIEDDPDYGRIVTIHEEDDLLRAIGCSIISRPRALTGSEFRFLRKIMEDTQEELAEAFGVNVQTIANYEKGKKIPGASDRLIRMMFALWTVPPDARASVLKDWERELLQRQERDGDDSDAPSSCSPFAKQWAQGGGELCHV
jgi:transcriptional regulator with XRE-family HTH domain